jgi:hypothetical protein
MKKLLSLIALSLISLFSFSQILFPAPSQNPFWMEEHGSLWTCGCGACSGYYCSCVNPSYYNGDTIIGSFTYFNLVHRGICHATYASGLPPYGCNYSCSWLESETVLAYIRIDSTQNRVYIHNGSQDILLYDFASLSVGNPYPKTYTNVLGDSLIVVSLDSILMGPTYARKWNLAVIFQGQVTDSAFVSIIEGIGSTFGHLAPLAPPFENGDILHCFSRNDSVFYPDSTSFCDQTVNIESSETLPQLNIYPNPCTDFLNIQSDHSGKIRISDINGCIMKEMHWVGQKIDVSNLSTGMYFMEFQTENTRSIMIFNKL